MTIAHLTPADLRLRDAVLQQLQWDSQVEASAIGVAAENGAVALTGFIDTYAGKLAAERAVKRVRGVRAVANDLQVRLRLERADDEIAEDVARALSVRATLPATVQAVVHNGHVTLTGTVQTLFAKAVAENAIRYVPGIKGIVNRIAVARASVRRDVTREIVRALHREAEVSARGIQVTVAGDTVTLTGTVASWHEREAAERAAMHAAGIAHVDNRIVLAPPAAADAVEPDEVC
jgi:osmotically-inducible protein OsmY